MEVRNSDRERGRGVALGGCNKLCLGSYSRVLAHLKIKEQGMAACNSVTPQHKFEMDKLNPEAGNLKKSK